MGNQVATIVVQTNEQSYIAGSRVTGKIYLHVQQSNRTTFDTTGLILTVHGIEKTCVQYTETHQERDNDDNNSIRSVQVDRFAYSHRNILRLEMIVNSFSSGMVRRGGDFEFPFEFELPRNLPASMLCHSNDGQSYCSINYTIEGSLRRPGILFSHIHHTTSFFVRTNPREIISPDFQRAIRIPPDKQNVNFCCCINRGTISLGAEIDKDTFNRNESVRVGFSVRNESSVNIDTVKVSFSEVVSWKAQGKSATCSFTLAERNMRPSCIKGTASALNPSRENLFADEESAYLYDPCQSIDFILSNTARDSHEGALIQVRHEIHVTAITPCCITSPEVNIPVFVQPELTLAHATVVKGRIVDANKFVGASAPLEPEISLSLPLDWSPRTAESSTLQVSHGILGGKPESSSFCDSTYYQQGMNLNTFTSTFPASENRREELSMFDELIDELDRTFDHVGGVSKFIKNSDFKAQLHRLTPSQLVEISKKVSFPLENIHVMKKMASGMGIGFTSAHLIALLNSAIYDGRVRRIELLRALLPLVNDTKDQREYILEALDSFEQHECSYLF